MTNLAVLMLILTPATEVDDCFRAQSFLATYCRSLRGCSTPPSCSLSQAACFISTPGEGHFTRLAD
ncbi:MAG: hypothetical protein WKH64_16250 [Chloroflexia bacterium]